MNTLLTTLSRRVHPLLRQAVVGLPRWAIRGAWFFAIVSAIPLLWLMFEGHGDGGNSRVFGASVDGVVHTVWGLTYSGFLGSVLLGLELVALVAAMIVTAVPMRHIAKMPVIRNRQHFAARVRQIGHGYLTGWAGLWMIGTMYLASVQPGLWTVQAMFITALFACTVYRAVKQWNDGGDVSLQGEMRADERIMPCDERPAPISQNRAESVQPVLAPETVAIANPHTDVAEVSRFMLHRSAIRPSDRVHEIDLNDGLEHVPPRRFQRSRAKTALDRDDYGESVRAAVRIAAMAVQSLAKKVISVVGDSATRLTTGRPRQPIQIDVAAAENHTDSLRIGRV